MKKILIFICFYKIIEGALVPAPFITDPDSVQRAGYDTTLKYFDRKLFSDCYGIAFSRLRNTTPQGELMVSSDCGWHRLIYIYLEEDTDQSASWIEAYGNFGSGVGQFDEPMGLCIDTTVYNGAGNEYTIYVADKCNNRVVRLKYNMEQELIENADTIGSGFSQPKDVACVTKSSGGAYVVVIEQGNHRLSLYETYSNESYSLIQRYGELGPGTGKFNSPSGIAICVATDVQGGYYIYVTDTGNNRIVCLRFIPGQDVAWETDYKKIGDCKFLSVTASQYYCVYVTAFGENKIYVFTPGLTELLYTYGDDNLLNGPKDVYIDWDRIGLTERWTSGTGIQYFKIIPEIREFYPDPDTFDATTDSVKINFRVDETSGYLTMMVAGDTLIYNEYFTPGTSSVYWDGRDGNGKVVVPGNYTIYMSCPGHNIGLANVTVKGTKIEGDITQLHWVPSNNPYVLVNECWLENADTLIIDPNVLIMGYDQNAKLWVGIDGVAKVLGTTNDSIVFTAHRKLAPQEDSTYPGMWGGVVIGTRSPQTKMNYCQVEYADIAIDIQSDSVLHDVVENCLLKDNIHAARSYFWSAGGFGNGNEYVDNDTNKIEVVPCYYEDTQILDTMRLKKQTIPYWFTPPPVDDWWDYEIYGWEDYAATLIIDPGVRIEFGENTILRIGVVDDWSGLYKRGKLICEGLESDSIIMTGFNGVFWRGIVFVDSSCVGDTSLIKYTSIEYSGIDIAAIVLGDSTSINITNNRIYKSKKYGVWMPNSSPYNNILVSNCLFEEDSIPVITSFGNLSGLNTCSFLDNENDIIEVLGHSGVHKNININYQPVPYYFLNRTPYGSDFAMYGEDTLVTLTIAPGTNIQCEGEVRLSIGQIDQNDRGNIIASGNSSSPVVFTAIDQAFPWHGIRLYAYDAQDTSIFEHCAISHVDGAGIQIYNTSPIIKNSIITNNENGIIVSGSDANPLIEGNLITLNKCGIHNSDTGSTSLSMCNNDIYGNKIAVKNELTSHYVDADSNWWGDSLGPWDPSPGLPDSNFAGRGDSIGDYVSYRPWLTEPVHQAENVTLITPNGGETLHYDIDTVIQWSRTVTPTKQELYYTTDFPEGGGVREEVLWKLIDTVNINDTSYLWHVPLTLSNRCRVAIKIFYDTETERQGDKETWRRGDTEKKEVLKLGTWEDRKRGKKFQMTNEKWQNTDYTDTNLKDLLQNTQIKGNQVIEGNFGQLKEDEIASSFRTAELLAMTNDYEYEGWSTSTIAVDVSDGNFAIVDTVSPQITLTSPNGGEYFIPTKAETIKWQASDNHKLDHFNIYLSTDGGTNYSTTIIQDLEAPCSIYAWVPSAENAYKCKVKVVAYDSSDNNDNDVSDDLFYIPVKSYSNEMTAYNNARRLVRSFFSNLHLVYTTQEDTETEGQRGQETRISGNQGIRGTNQDIRRSEDHYIRERSNKYKGRSTSKICYIKSTDGGNLWFSDTELGDGIYPSMAMDNYANKIGVAWTNVSGSIVLYKYCNPFGIWSGLYTIFSQVSDVTYSPVAIQFAKDSIHLVSLRTTQITSSELVQDVLYLKFPWTDPSSCATMDTINHWRIAYENPLPEFVSIAVDYDGVAHLAWERPPGDTMFTTPTPFDIFYALRGGLFITGKYNISNSDDNSIHPSADCYGGHCYVVWQEKVNGYNVFLYKRNYVQFPPKPETDTISQTSANSVYPVSRMGGVVLWAEGDPAEIYGRIWNSKKEYWLEVENWSNTSDNSMYPQVDAWNNMGSTDIMCNWTENTDTCGLGKRFVSFWPSKDHANISFPSYCLTLGDSMSTPFTEYRDTIAIYQEDKFDLGVDSLVYYLPYINRYAKCRIVIELYRPDVSEGSTLNKNSNWKIRLNVDGIMHRIIRLSPGELKTLDLDVPWLVNINGSARIKFKKMRGDFILVRRILFYEYERGEKDTGSFLAGGGPQSDEIMQVSPVFFEGIYPNPTRGNLRIRFNSPDEQKVTIKLYDVTGRLVNEIFNGKAKIGINEMPIMAANYAAGIYFIRIETDKEIITEKFIMLK
ncbi:T9SS type A sorting domain-containing protein [candidate division WOR-3 bacterium]|nr:T9SS type A sorting domain-containing protein [candidate division WOR-3 bacterium]